MKKILSILLIVPLCVFFGCTEDTVDLVGKGVITGRVVEAKNFKPIENVKISLNPSNNTVFTDAEGYFDLVEVEVGDYSVSAKKEGFLTTFEAATVSKNLEVNVIFEMEVETALNKPPLTPQLISPINGSENQELSVELLWSSSDPDDDLITYRLEIKNDLNDEVINVNALVDTTYVINDLKYGTKYFWQIAANDEINPEVLSTVNSFRTKTNPDNRYLYVQKNANNNHVLFSASYNESENTSENMIQLTSDDQNSWRPRRNLTSGLIAFLRTSDNETHLFTMNQDGSDVTRVTSSVPIAGYNLNEIDFSWSSNGDRLLYPNYDKLYVINKDGSGLRLLYQTLDGSLITECDWSKDESIIAIKTNDMDGYQCSILTIDAEGNTLKTILEDVKGAAGGLNISVDNKLLVYTYDVSEYESPDHRQLDTHLFMYNLESNTVLDLSEDKNLGTIDLDPRFSPNESDVIFVNTSNDGISQRNIYRLGISAGSSSELLFSNALMPDWE